MASKARTFGRNTGTALVRGGKAGGEVVVGLAETTAVPAAKAAWKGLKWLGGKIAQSAENLSKETPKA